MKTKMHIFIILLISIALQVPSVSARKLIIIPEKVAVITSPSESRDMRVLLFFSLPEDVLDSRAIVDFATLNCEAQVTDAAMGQIDIFPITSDWKSIGDISWVNPWNNAGGDYSEEYLESNYTLKSEWGTKEISIDITEIVQDWQKGAIFNNGIIVKISQDDLDNYTPKYNFDRENIKIRIHYSHEYK